VRGRFRTTRTSRTRSSPTIASATVGAPHSQYVHRQQGKPGSLRSIPPLRPMA
jgi:hypothetical protein